VSTDYIGHSTDSGWTFLVGQVSRFTQGQAPLHAPLWISAP